MATTLPIPPTAAWPLGGADGRRSRRVVWMGLARQRRASQRHRHSPRVATVASRPALGSRSKRASELVHRCGPGARANTGIARRIQLADRPAASARPRPRACCARRWDLGLPFEADRGRPYAARRPFPQPKRPGPDRSTLRRADRRTDALPYANPPVPQPHPPNECNFENGRGERCDSTRSFARAAFGSSTPCFRRGWEPREHARRYTDGARPMRLVLWSCGPGRYRSGQPLPTADPRSGTTAPTSPDPTGPYG